MVDGTTRTRTWIPKRLGLHDALHFLLPHLKFKNVYIFADNSAAIWTVFEGRPGLGQATSRTFRRTALEFLDANFEHQLHIGWVPGHSNIEGNDRADVRANLAAETTHPGAITTMCHLRRRARKAITEAWHSRWATKGPSGHFAPADRFPPSFSPSPLLSSLTRSIFSLVTQARIGRAHTGEYYRWRIPGEPTNGPCGAALQTRTHILQDCSRYAQHQHILRKVSLNISLPSILGTDKGISALAEFIRKTGAFTKEGTPWWDPNDD